MTSTGRDSRRLILVVESDGILRHALAGALSGQGLEVVEAGTREEALRKMAAAAPDAIVLGMSRERHGGGRDGLIGPDAAWPRVPCVLLAHTSTEQVAIAAIKAGIADYFSPPFVPEDVAASVARLIGVRSARPDVDSGMVGDSQAIQMLIRDIRRIAQTDSPVLITGETGTGKGLVAQLVHRSSGRARRQLLSINCAAIPDTLLESELFGHERGAFTGADSQKQGLLQAADGGTVLLDEIGDMSLGAQAKILRVLEDRSVQRLGGTRSIVVDVRVVAATNQPLETLMRDGRFRRDLYYRVNVAHVHLPPLRERITDIPKLIDYYVADLNRRFGRRVQAVADDAMEELVRYSWPGNVRELKNFLEGIFVNLPERHIDVLRIPARLRRKIAADERCESAERERLLAALLATRWNKTKAAQQLQWSRMTLYRKVRKYRLDASDDAANAPAIDDAHV